MFRSAYRSPIRLGLAILLSGVMLAGGVTAAQAAPPPAPSSVTGIGYVNAVRLSWVPPDDGGNPITQYVVQDDLGYTWPAVSSDALTYPFVVKRLPDGVTPLPNGVARTFRVRADNADGVGAWSAYSAAVTPHAVYATPKWTSTGSISGARENARGVLLSTGKVLVVGGNSFDPVTWTSTPLATARLYDPVAGTWAATGSLPAARSSFALAVLAGGQVQLSGGYNSSWTPVTTTYLYTPSTGVWTTGRPMLRARANHTATVLSTGLVLVAGGSVTGGAATNTAETYNPATTSWTATGLMPSARTRQTAGRLPSGAAGQVILVGGNDGSAGLRPTALYQQATRTWTTGASLVTRRSSDDVGDPTVTTLADGRLLVAGGYNAGVLRSAEIYTPSTNTFASVAAMPFATEGQHTATLLADGRVLVAGGIDDWGGLATTQIYSPSVNRWSRGNDLPVERAGQVAVRLPSGAVLLVGGYRWLPTYTTVATAVRYQP